MKINLEVFDWELSEVDLEKIKQVSQCRGFKGERFVTENGPYKTTEDLFDWEDMKFKNIILMFSSSIKYYVW